MPEPSKFEDSTIPNYSGFQRDRRASRASLCVALRPVRRVDQCQDRSPDRLRQFGPGQDDFGHIFPGQTGAGWRMAWNGGFGFFCNVHHCRFFPILFIGFDLRAPSSARWATDGGAIHRPVGTDGGGQLVQLTSLNVQRRRSPGASFGFCAGLTPGVKMLPSAHGPTG